MRKVYNMMEDELKCPVCHHFFTNPLILPCTHNLCYKCAELLIHEAEASREVAAEDVRSSSVLPQLETDKASVASETVLSDSDSGYSAAGSNCSGGGCSIDHTSMVATSNVQPPAVDGEASHHQNIAMPSLPKSVTCLTCPVCHRTLFLDDRGAASLVENALMKSIVERYCGDGDGSTTRKRKQLPMVRSASFATTGDSRAKHQANVERRTSCEMCESEPSCRAAVRCQQCSVHYCERCRDHFHPARGPLAKHTLVPLRAAVAGRECQKPDVPKRTSVPVLPNKPLIANGVRLSSCPLHPTENMSLHCEPCHASLCVQCQDEGKHKCHVLKPIGLLYKSQKGQLSQHMSALSNKARKAKDLVHLLRSTQEEIQHNALDLEAKTVAQWSHVIACVERKRDEMVQRIARDKEVKCKGVRDQLQQCTMKLKQTTGLLEYCIEVMKENDPTAFLQVSKSLIDRVACTEKQWQARNLMPRSNADFDLNLETEGLVLEVEKLDFIEIRAPDNPIIEVNKCSSKNNTVTIAWKMMTSPTPQQPVDGYKLEMDDGNNGAFREVYSGNERVCTVDGLHFNSVYRARIRAHNSAGQSSYSEQLHLQTAEVASFQLDPSQSHSELILGKNNTTGTGHREVSRTALANVGFSQGVHYWELSIDRISDEFGDVGVGIARSDVDRSACLGKDGRGWAMHVTRSHVWQLHDGQPYARIKSGVETGSRLGVLLNFSRRTITFFLDGKNVGEPMTFKLLTAASTGCNPVFFPAISVDNNVEVTLHTGLHCPMVNNDQTQPSYRSRIHSAPQTPTKPFAQVHQAPPLPSLAGNLYSTKSDDETLQKLPSTDRPVATLRRGNSGGNISSVSSETNLTIASDPMPCSMASSSGKVSFRSFFKRTR